MGRVRWVESALHISISEVFAFLMTGSIRPLLQNIAEIRRGGAASGRLRVGR
jgi:hypothetical protein